MDASPDTDIVAREALRAARRTVGTVSRLHGADSHAARWARMVDEAGRTLLGL